MRGIDSQNGGMFPACGVRQVTKLRRTVASYPYDKLPKMCMSDFSHWKYIDDSMASEVVPNNEPSRIH